MGFRIQDEPEIRDDRVSPQDEGAESPCAENPAYQPVRPGLKQILFKSAHISEPLIGTPPRGRQFRHARIVRYFAFPPTSDSFVRSAASFSSREREYMRTS